MPLTWIRTTRKPSATNQSGCGRSWGSPGGSTRKGVDQFVKLLEDLRRENKTVIVASHDEIPGLVYDRRLRMKDGILLAEE